MRSTLWWLAGALAWRRARDGALRRRWSRSSLGPTRSRRALPRPPPSTTARATRYRAVISSSPSIKFATAWGRPTGTPATIPACRRSSPWAAKPRASGRAPCATIRTARGAPRTRASSAAEGLLHSADVRLQERPARQRRAAQAEHTADDRLRRRDDGRRNSRGRRVLQLDALDAVDRGRGNRHRAENAASRHALEARRRASRNRSPSASASSNRPSTPSTPSSCVIRGRASSPTYRKALLRAARSWRATATRA